MTYYNMATVESIKQLNTMEKARREFITIVTFRIKLGFTKKQCFLIP